VGSEFSQNFASAALPKLRQLRQNFGKIPPILPKFRQLGQSSANLVRSQNSPSLCRAAGGSSFHYRAVFFIGQFSLSFIA
jgi:hypothetical protein